LRIKYSNWEWISSSFSFCWWK